jgi:protein SCO1/2
MALSRPAGQQPASGRRPASASPRRLVAFGLVGLGVALLLAALAYVLGFVQLAGQPGLTGALINPPFMAPDFQLNDQFGQPVSLSSNRGKVVVLTFLYTNCPDACPLITEKLHQAYQQLGPATSKLTILAVTVDPARDTTAQVRSYSAQKDMLDKWHYLVGAAPQLMPIWQQYGIEATPADAVTAMDQATAVALGQATPTPLPISGTVDHSSPIFIIDPAGNARAVLDVNFAPTDLVQDVKALLNQ